MYPYPVWGYPIFKKKFRGYIWAIHYNLSGFILSLKMLSEILPSYLFDCLGPVTETHTVSLWDLVRVTR